MKIKYHDRVKIITGKEKGKSGEVLKVTPAQNLVLVSGLNMVKKHIKPSGKERGGIRELEKPLPVSKVVLLCPKCQKPTRVGYRLTKLGKVRICRKCHEEIDNK